MPINQDGDLVLTTELPDLPVPPPRPPSTSSPSSPSSPSPSRPTPVRPTASDINSTASGERRETITGIGAMIPLIYGRAQIQGQIVAAAGLSGGSQLQLSVIWCLGQVQEIERVDAGEKLGSNINITGGIEYWYPSDEPAFSVSAVMGRAKHYTGTTAQGVDPWLASAIAGYGDTNIIDTRDGSTAGIAYSSVTLFRPDKWQGFPRLSATIKGCRVWDPRSSTTAYSDNPALCLADFLSNTSRGLGKPIDWDSVEDAADYCDSLVGGQKRRTFGLALDRESPAEQWIEAMRAYAGCIVYRRGDEYVLIPDKAGPVSIALTAADIVDRSMSLKKRSVGESPTVIRVQWTDTTKTIWQQRETPPVMLPGVETGAVPWRESRVSLPGIQRFSQANREAIERLNYFSLQDLEASFEVFDVGLKIEPGDIISVTHPIGLTAKQMRVTDIDQVRPARWQIQALEYDPAVYSSVVQTEPTYPDTTLQNPGLVPAVTGLTALEEVYRLTGGGYSSRFRVSWTPVDFGYLANYSLVMFGGGNARHLSIPAGANSVTIEGITQGVSYMIAVSAVSTIGAKGTAGATNITCQGKTLPPGDVPGVDAYEVGGTVYVSWEEAIDIDLVGYEVRVGAIGSIWSTATQIDPIRINALNCQISGLPTGSWLVFVKALDASRNYSQTATSVIVNVTQYDNVPLTIDLSYSAADINVGLSSGYDSYIVRGDADATYYYSIGSTPPNWSTAFPNAMSTYVNPIITYAQGDGGATLRFNNKSLGSVVPGAFIPTGRFIVVSGGLFVRIDPTGGGDDRIIGRIYDDYDIDTEQRYGVGNTVGLRFLASPGDAFVVRLPGFKVKVDSRPRQESGSNTSSAAGAKTITLNSAYSSLDAVKITPSVAGNYICAFNNINLNSVEGTNTFDVHIYQSATTADSSGPRRVAVPFTWEITGY